MNGTALRAAPPGELCEPDRRSVRPGDPLENDPVRILTEPENSPIRQYTAPMATKEVTVEFTADAIASLAAEVDAGVENIGARRLHTTMERLLEDVSFSAADRAGATVVFDAAAVEKTLGRPGPRRRPEQVHPVARRLPGAARARPTLSRRGAPPSRGRWAP